MLLTSFPIQTRPFPVSGPVLIGFYVSFSDIFTHVGRERFTAYSPAFRVTTPSIEHGCWVATSNESKPLRCRAHRSTFASKTSLATGILYGFQHGYAGKIKTGGVKFRFFPRQPHIVMTNAKDKKMRRQLSVFDGMNGVQILAKQL